MKCHIFEEMAGCLLGCDCKSITCLAEFRQEKGELRPLDFSRSVSRETRTESMKMDPVADARRATLFLMTDTERPFRPCKGTTRSEAMRKEFQKKVLITLSKMKPRMRSSHLQTAHIMKTSLKSFSILYKTRTKL
jgi:hypothetical protein